MTKPGASAQDFDVALERCKAEAYLQMPAQRETYISRQAYYSDGPETCISNASNSAKFCHREKVWNPPVTSTRDVNADARETLTRSCLYSDGWRPEQ
ncbi:hypothetical protein ACT6QH_14370 [Xanthobacter sp. TB0139]|uniref:hypothetical protein n=1 Tax=Xanthobacter sp. TB0139 TaxID=3459178 RepID=UPI0040396650